MPYIRRNANAKIIELCDNPSAEAIEYLDPAEPEVQSYIEHTQRNSRVKQDLLSTDLETVRVLEDLIEVLLSKGVITAADIPDSAREKLDRRKQLRAVLRESPLVSDDIF
jgi:hypothetical protein